MGVLWCLSRVLDAEAQPVPAPDEPPVAASALATGPVADAPELFRERTRPLADLGADLAAPDSAVRLRAFDALRSLSASRVADVEARLRHLRLTADPPAAAVFNSLVEVRHHLGLASADDPTDLALGVRRLLEAPRAPSRTMLQVTERLALLRGLEHMDSLAADRVMVGFFQRGWAAWQWEARHLVGRRGLRMLPALIEGRSAGNPDVRRWAVGSCRRLGVDSVGAAVQMVAPTQLPDVLRAYAALSDLNAMPAVISFVDHPDDAVREASREATESYERNAIWQLRLAYRNKLGENADLRWSWATTMRRLFDALDARRLAPANELLDEGLAAAGRRDWDVMRERYDRALRREPLLPRRPEMSAGYAAEATQRLDVLADSTDAQAVDGALGLLRRAVRLAPEHPDAGSWRATVAFHEAERARSRGVLDEGAYEAVLAARPNHPGAAAVLADIEDGGVGEVDGIGRSLAARILFFLGVLCFLPYRRLAALTHVALQRMGPATRAVRALVVRGWARRRLPVAAPDPVDLGAVLESDPSVQHASAPTPGAPPVTGADRAAGSRLGPVYRTARRLAFFVRSLGRTWLARHPGSGGGGLRALARRGQAARRSVMDRLSKVSGLGALTAWLRRPRIEADRAKAPRRRPSLAEVRSTLSMLASPEPPKLNTPWERKTAPLGATTPAAPVRVSGAALETEGLASRGDDELAALLFGDSEPGIEVESGARHALRASPTPARDLVSTLTQFAHDTSPGLLEAPDTLPG
jgi:hypothetical protein